MSGPSSAKAGMQGNSDSVNGCNCFYDEMIDELLGGGGQMKDGDNRLEYWKRVLQHALAPAPPFLTVFCVCSQKFCSSASSCTSSRLR